MAPKFLLPLYILLHHLPLRSIASNPGTLALFLDEECSQASTINQSVNVTVDTCLVTPGALGIAVETLPPCASGDATLIIYRDTSCTNPLDSDIQYNNCYFDGPNGVPAVLFACTAAARGSAATATSTVFAGLSSMPVAVDTPTTTSSGGTPDQTTPSSNSATTTSTPPSDSTSPNSSQTNTNGGGGDGSGTGSGSGLSEKGQIALGVGLPVGSIVVALLAWWFPCKKRR
ncbi:hypothetical protein MMC28_011583 [Mycoblastus sanguinarius]|nr:hypothetical protein [Mycoblastus sanguinarius]